MLECLDNAAQPFSRPPGHQRCQENSWHQWPAQETKCWHCHPAGNMASQCRHTEGEGLHIFWQGKSSNEPREHGVGFAVKNSLLSMVEPGSSSSEWLLNLCLNTTKAQSPSSVCTPQCCLPLWMPRMNSMRTLHPPSGTSPVLSNLFSWATSMPEWVQTMTHGPLALVLLEWGKWMRMGSDCSNSVSFTTCAPLTPSSRPSLNTRSPGDTHAQSIGTNWIWPWSGVLPSRTFFTHTLTTVQTVTWTTPWYAVRSGCNQKSSIVQRNQGTCILMSARWLSQILWNSLQRPLRRNMMHHSPEILPQRSGKLCKTPSTTSPWLSLGRKPQSHMTGMRPSPSRMTPVIEAKHATLAEYKWSPIKWNLQTLRAARSKVQCITRCCTNEYWTEHNEMIQMATAMGNVRWMYDGIKKALGPM